MGFKAQHGICKREMEPNGLIDSHANLQGCNLILQWWIMKHLWKTHDSKELDSKIRSDQFASHDMWLYLRKFKPRHTQAFLFKTFNGLRDENVQWSIDDLILGDTVIQGNKLPFLVFVGTRPYVPARILRQLGDQASYP